MRTIEGKRVLAARTVEVTDIASVLMVLMYKCKKKSLFKADQESMDDNADVDDFFSS